MIDIDQDSSDKSGLSSSIYLRLSADPTIIVCHTEAELQESRASPRHFLPEQCTIRVVRTWPISSPAKCFHRGCLRPG